WSNPRSCYCFRQLATLFPRGRPDLAALLQEQDVGIGLLAVDEVSEPAERGRVFDRLLPLTFVAGYYTGHVRFQLRGNSQLIATDHTLQVLQAAFEVVPPGRCPLQSICCPDVEHQKAVD